MAYGKFRHKKNLFFIQCVQPLLMLCLFFLYERSTAQTLNRAEYFFDSDPGTGKATPVTITPGASVDFSFAANILTLSNGFHNLNFRIRDNTGKWSHFQSRTFYIVSNASLVTSSSITRAEYFFDSDPGVGKGISVLVTPGLTINQNVAIPITSLTPGFHNLNLRTIDNRGQWSHFATRTFYIVPPFTINTPLTIQKAEYFFDSDPGVGKGINVPVTSASSIDQNVAIPITSLAPGFHNLNIRTRDDLGRWSHFATRTFYIVPPFTINTPLTIQKAEYFFDSDPGVGKGINVPVTSASSIDQNVAIPITSLAPGFHNLNLRTRDDRGRWSHFATRTFYVMPGNALPASSLSKLEYFIDTDPGIGKATNLSFTPGTSIDKLYAIDLTGVPSGAHKLSVRAKDSNGFWSTIFTSPFTLLNCTPPTAPVALSVERCGTGRVTFNASGGTGSQVYRWYTDATTPAILSVGPSYKTDSLLATRNYFVSVYDPLTFCESNRTQVTATILILPKPVLNLTGSLSVCDGNAIALRGPSGFSTYTWSNGLMTQEITVTTSGIFTLKVNDGKCTSPASDPFTLTVQPKPAAPIVQPGAGSSLLLCAKGTVTLNASGASGSQVYRWYNDAITTTTLSVGTTYTTDSLLATRKYFVAVYDPSTLCESKRTELTITVTILPKPSLNLTGPLTICDGNSIVLRAPPGFKTYLWSNGLTTSEITVVTTGNYTVKVGDGICTSPVSNTFALTVEQKPAKPVIQINGSTTLCGSETRMLAAPPGFTRYLWSTAETTQQITVSATGDYTVKVINSSGCESPISTPITITSFVSPAKPIIQTVGSPVLCNTNTSVKLRAPFGFTIYQSMSLN